MWEQTPTGLPGIQRDTNTYNSSFSSVVLYVEPWANENVDTKAKCRHLKKLTCKGTLRQVFRRVYRLEIQSVMLVFSTQLCELLPI
jgi:hypothetical protein